MYEKYETSYFCKLWRSIEACNLIALDFNGDFVLYVHPNWKPKTLMAVQTLHVFGAEAETSVET